VAVDLAYTQVKDAEVKELAALKGLQSLDLSSTKVTDAGMKHLAGLKGLRSLNLNRTRASIDIHSHLCRGLTAGGIRGTYLR
jgi:hypothetical protein